MLSVCLVGVLFRSFSRLGLLSLKMLGVGFPHVAITNQEQSEYKHSLTFRIMRYVVIASKPMHQMQI